MRASYYNPILLFLFLSFSLFGNNEDLKRLEKQANQTSDPVLFMQLSNQYLEKEELILAKQNAEKGLMHASKTEDLKLVAEAHQVLGEIAQFRFDYTNAIEHFLMALDASKKTADELGLAKAAEHIGRILYTQQSYEDALDHLNQAKVNYEKHKENLRLANLQQYLGDVYLAQNFYGKAKNSYTSAIDLYLENKKPKKAAEIARYLGRVTRDLGDYEGALVYFSQSLDLHGSLEDLANIGHDYNDLALTNYAQGEYEEALENNAFAYDLRTELKDTMGIIESLKNNGMFHTALGEADKAVPFLKNAASQLRKVAVNEQTPAIYKDIANSFSALKNYEEAFKCETDFAKSQKALFEQDKATALLELTTRYASESEAEEQKQQIALLEKDKAVGKRVRFFLLALIALIVSLLGLLFYHFQRKKQDNLLLKEKNEEILWQKEEIDRQNIQLEEKAASLDLLNNKLVAEMAERESIERSSFARDSFLAMMSHQMRTPINIIVGLTHLLLEDNPRESQKESLRNLQFSANNLVVFINDVLDYSKIEAGKLVMQNRTFKLSSVIKDIQSWSRARAEEKQVELKLNVEKTVPENLIGDPARLNQILTNLISNSLSYTEKGKIEIGLSLQSLNTDDVNVEINIKDNGKGIEKAKLEEMFRKFTRDPEADIYEGFNTTGLELAITKRLVDLQNGHIEAHSEKGVGTSFKVILPYKIPVKGANVQPSSKKDQISYHYLVGKKILVVEDNKINQLVVRKMLQKLGVIVTTANNGLIALDKIQDTYFDLILMDIQMPKMDGYRATAEIRKSKDPKIANVPIIALTASAYLTEKEKAQLFGMNDHVGKPFGPEELMEKISCCLAEQERGVRVVKNRLN